MLDANIHKNFTNFYVVFISLRYELQVLHSFYNDNSINAKLWKCIVKIKVEK